MNTFYYLYGYILQKLNIDFRLIWILLVNRIYARLEQFTNLPGLGLKIIYSYVRNLCGKMIKILRLGFW